MITDKMEALDLDVYNVLFVLYLRWGGGAAGGRRGGERGREHNPPPVTQEYEGRRPHKNT